MRHKRTPLYCATAFLLERIGRHSLESESHLARLAWANDGRNVGVENEKCFR
jgi:hypothetical protein